MGYFSNGTENDMYVAEYCQNCKHGDWFHDDTGDVPMCAVMMAHLLYNYDECNNKESILHILIPRDGKGYNEQCLMFLPRQIGE